MKKNLISLLAFLLGGRVCFSESIYRDEFSEASPRSTGMTAAQVEAGVGAVPVVTAEDLRQHQKTNVVEHAQTPPSVTPVKFTTEKMNQTLFKHDYLSARDGEFKPKQGSDGIIHNGPFTNINGSVDLSHRYRHVPAESFKEKILSAIIVELSSKEGRPKEDKAAQADRTSLTNILIGDFKSARVAFEVTPIKNESGQTNFLFQNVVVESKTNSRNRGLR